MNVKDLELQIKRTVGHGPDAPQGSVLVINVRHGFELGGSYETWGYEFDVTDPHHMDYRYGRQGTLPISVRGSTLEIAISRWQKALNESKAAQESDATGHKGAL